MRMLSEEEANEIEVTWEDQQSINAFSRLNSTFSDVAEDLRVRKEEREALDDLSMELELADEDEAVLYKIADTFVSLPHAEAMERLEKEQQQADEEIEGLQGRLDGFEDEMKSLKVKLYAKFGDNINLERD
ncbi:Prefoldin beta-like protein [Kalmanozyma brasiliensis GHG001]|uniref:Prefoldin subunit 4 n=1 Tax=Kalmanozyma brasiliensis (strain GHG001) TaxID=1365824 RepID=V5F0U7_KALBG|nr:Prefoldin beta-like protein [Kalmanozyma brasiliensis GHG001]EST08884.1 Prefoldin beta-like protein [Kalmanozyma brasiliensis GHG001]